MEPEEVTFELLKTITNDFSEDQKLGEGAFGAVYKGVTRNGDVVAVKKLRNGNPNLDDKQFQNEFDNLARLTHQNIVQILGYCYEAKKTPTKFDGRTVLTEEIQRALCFEYLPNGTLQNHLNDEFRGSDWHTRYNIIKGVCEGLYYLHKGCDKPIYHLDLKPENILLDNDLVPKIADLGLSMISSTEKTRTKPNSVGTLGYRPKEHVDTGEISDKFDIFSLGVVMIKIISGAKGYFECAQMNKDEFIDQVNKNWKDRLQAKCSGSLLEVYGNQVQICTEIALNCVEDASQNRPDIGKIIDRLNETENDIGKLPDKRCSEIASRITMHNEIPDQTQHFNKTTSARSNISARSNELEGIPDTSMDIGEKYIVGRTDEKQKIIGSLLQCRPCTITILPIYGIGGIGKTTFAKLIYNGFNDFFRVWVSVSQTFDLIKIRNSIITQLSGKDSKNKERQDIDNCLKDILSGEKILVVLDDLWEHNVFQLNNLKAMLCPVGENNTLCVLVTTRNEYIAEKICMNHEPHKIKSLTDELCWDIIKHRSCFEARHDKEHLTGIGMDIARKCRGVALAAQSLGFILQSMTSDQWTKVRDNDIWNESVVEDASSPNNVLPSLKLSYDNMTQSLKSCFSYCAIFPKGHKIAPNDLIYQWISLGFVKPTRLLSPKQLCEKYIMQLQGLSFLENSILSDMIYDDDHKLTRVSMHDLVHDLARSVMVDEILDATKECQNQGYSYCYASLPLSDCGKALELSTTSLAKIKAMHFLRYDRIETCDAAFSSAKSLRVLDTSKCRKSPLSDSISELKQLRYLSLKYCKKDVLYRVTELSKLIYLNLSGHHFTALPESIGALKDLMYLDISLNPIKELPDSFMNLKRLVHLNLSRCNLLTVESKTLVGLKNIEYLNLTHIRRLGNSTDMTEVIANLTELRYLNLRRILPISGDEAFNLIDCICTLPNLEHLDLSTNRGIVKLPESIGKLRKLCTLILDYCHSLVKLPECMAKMDSLKVLSLEKCFHLPEFIVQEDGDASSINMGFLKFINHKQLHMRRLNNVKSTEQARGIKLVKKQRMRELELEWTTDARRSVEDMEVLGELVPPSTLREFKIKGYSSVGLPAWVMDIASFLPILTGITVEDLPKCCILPPLGLLPNLKKLVIAAMDSITTIEEGFYGCARAFPQLEIFELHNMKNLEGWSIMHSYSHDGVKEFMFPNLVELDISDCPKLRLLSCLPRARKWKIQNSDSLLSTCGNVEETCSSCSSELRFAEVTVKYSKLPLDRWRLLRHIPGISGLTIQYCTDLACSSPEIVPELGVWTCPRLSDFQQESMQCLTSLRRLSLEDCPSITALPESLGDLTSLKYLAITRCPGVKCLPVSIRKLAKLATLYVSHSPALEELESLGDLTSLKNLTITKCPGVKCLPVSLRKLTKLRRLFVAQCPVLEELESLGDLTSLVTLTIIECPGVKCLPVSIMKLTKLRKLRVADCPVLEEWFELENQEKLAHIRFKKINGRDLGDNWSLECISDSDIGDILNEEDSNKDDIWNEDTMGTAGPKTLETNVDSQKPSGHL